ncbi:coat protein [ssRNA phage Gerhypos.1_48]|uniref:Coat protein n=2 Tax=Fiersviridae TaxID=2842319 RepID=A0A8S5L2C8_9VIRU|nr:coat protein [ssRNA phage Gerhypos.1_48]QDH90596.1 MAG: hypothetical protein H1Bulk30308_000002 [Leviviridae sp.]DAD51533.1 TPA_asm: coat protein [ssRNA phage Gerhypos.1_48]
MSASNIVLNDAQATPVAHTFKPRGLDPKGNFWWEDQTGSSSLGYNRISMKLVRAAVPVQGQSSKDLVNRVQFGIHTPVLETLGTADNGMLPPPQVAYVPRCVGEFILSDRSNDQERKDLRKYMEGLMGEAQLEQMVETLLSAYAT